MAKVITFAQQKGGAGKTTMLTQLAVAMKGDERLALIDLDPQKTLTGWMDARIRRTGDADMDLIESSEWRIGVDIGKASRDAGLIMIDCPGNADMMLNKVLRASDLVLTPAQPSAPDVWATSATVRMAMKQGADAWVVLNRVPPRGVIAEEMAAKIEEDGADMLAERLGNRADFAKAFARGAGVTEVARKSKAAGEVEALAKAVGKLLR